MLLLLAVMWFVTCSVIPCQPRGDAVERITKVQVELEEFSVAHRGQQSLGETLVQAGWVGQAAAPAVG